MSALKGQKATSPGQRPGFIRAHIIPRPERAKAFHSEGNIQAAAMCCKAFDLVLSCRDSAKQTSLLALAAPRFAPSGRKLLWPFVPRALPWAGCSLPLRGVLLHAIFILVELRSLSLSLIGVVKVLFKKERRIMNGDYFL